MSIAGTIAVSNAELFTVAVIELGKLLLEKNKEGAAITEEDYKRTSVRVFLELERQRKENQESGG